MPAAAATSVSVAFAYVVSEAGAVVAFEACVVFSAGVAAAASIAVS